MEEAPALTAVLVDSDVIIEVLRHRNPDLEARWRSIGYGGADVYCSPVTLAEIWRGVLEGEHQMVESLFSAITCLPIHEEIGRKAGEYLPGRGTGSAVPCETFAWSDRVNSP